MNYQVKPFEIELYDSVIQLWGKCEGVGLGKSDSKENINGFLNRNPGMGFVAIKGEKIIGAVLCGHDGRRGYIHHLAVEPAEREQGIGKKLIEFCLNSFKEYGILKCHIFIFNSNETGRKFWESIGWEYRKDISLISKFID